MGFRNAPAHFMREVDTMLMEANIREHNATYVDDVTTHGESFEEYVREQERLFEVLAKNRWLVAADKLRLGYTRISILGWLIGQGERRPDPAKLDGVRKL